MTSIHAEIIPAQESHIEEVNVVVGEVAREREYLTFFDAFPMESTREFIMGNIANGNPNFVALVENKIIGWCDITRNTSRPVNRHSGTMGMGILARYRGIGIGRKLLAAAINAAKEKGIFRIELTVRETNHIACTLYEKMGFVREGTLRKEWHVDDKYYDTHVMALLLPPLCEA